MENRWFGEKWIGNSAASVIIELVLPSKSLSGMRLTERVGILNFQMREWSKKQWVEPESTKACSETCGKALEVILSIKDVDKGIELALSFTSSCMCTESMQPPAHAEVSGLLTNFLSRMSRLSSHPWYWPVNHLLLWSPGPLALWSLSGSL